MNQEAERIAKELVMPIMDFEQPTQLEREAAALLLSLKAEVTRRRDQADSATFAVNALKAENEALRKGKEASELLKTELALSRKSRAALSKANEELAQWNKGRFVENEALRVSNEKLRDVMWTLTEHNALHFGDNHSTVIQGRAAMKGEPHDPA